MTTAIDPAQAAGGRPSALRRRRATAHPVLRILIQRVLLAIPLLVAVSFLTYLLVWLAPADPARLMAGPNASEEVYLAMREKMQLDEPIFAQYWSWLTNAVQGDLGSSVFSGVEVSAAIGQRLPITISLVLGTMLLSTLFGILLGVLSALRGGATGRLIDAAALLGFALPSFWIAAQLIRVFSVQLGWLPSTGYVPLEASAVGWAQSILLPVTALALGGVAAIAKQTRASMVEALGSPHVRAARANGIGELSLVLRHALRNALMTVVTVVGVLFATMLGGTLFAEQVFALPGLGSLLVASAVSKDLPMVQGVALFFTLLIVVINILVELAYAWLDPKLRSSR